MGTSIVADLLELMPDTLSAQAGSLDGFGKFTASGSPTTHSCRIEGSRMLVRNAAGQEVVSSFQVFVGDTPGFTVEGHRFTLPARFSEPRTDLEALAIEPVADEGGAHHEVIFFP